MITTQNVDYSSKVKQDYLPFYLYISLAILWAYSGVVPVLFAQAESLTMLAQLGVPNRYQMVIFLSASLLDLGFGILILTHYRQYSLLWLIQLMVVVSYSIIIGIGLTDNWTHPFAPLIKNVPIMALLLFLYQHHKRIGINNRES